LNSGKFFLGHKMTGYYRKNNIINIMSLKYAPGLLKEMFAIARALETNGHKARIVLSVKYKWMLSDDYFSDQDECLVEFVENSISVIREKYTKDGDSIIFYNFHPVNMIVGIRATNPIVYMHEPYMPDKWKYGYKRMMLVYVFEIIQALFVLIVRPVVVLPSENAKYKFCRSNYYWLIEKVSRIKKYVVPLMLNNLKYDDKVPKGWLFLGNIHKAKSLDRILSVLKVDGSKKITILTRDALDDRVLRDYQEEISGGRLNILVKNKISESLVARNILESYGVMKVDSLMTQSGIVPLSFSYGRPLIVRDIPGFTQDVQHEATGIILKEVSVDAIISAMNEIELNFEQYSHNSKNEFLNKFSVNGWGAGWQRVIDGL